MDQYLEIERKFGGLSDIPKRALIAPHMEQGGLKGIGAEANPRQVAEQTDLSTLTKPGTATGT